MAKPAPRRSETYRFPLSLLLRFILAMLQGRKRSLGPDISGALKTARPQPRILDEDQIPAEGAFVLAANHYERPGLRVFWGGMLAANAVYQRRSQHRTVRWLMTSEWYNFRLAGLLPVPTWFLRWLFRRLSYVYGLVIVPRAPQRVIGRAAAMRSILEVIEEGEPIGLFPEGLGKEELVEAMPGTGLFLESLCRRGVSILPTGIYEQEGALTVRFGPPFLLQTPRRGDKQERDRLAREELMARIGSLLPQRQWGHYAPAIERLLAGGSRIA